VRLRASYQEDVIDKKDNAMTTHATGTRAEWLAARVPLLNAETNYAHQGDELARRRQQLPWVRVDKEDRFDIDKGAAWLQDLFRRRSQLLAHHLMFRLDFKVGCPSCSMIADAFNGIGVHLANHDLLLWRSRASLPKLQACWAFFLRQRLQFRHQSLIPGRRAALRSRIPFSSERPHDEPRGAGKSESGPGRHAAMTGVGVADKWDC
jgi:hypothetical protein